MDDFAGKVAIVAGGSLGIGKATAARLAMGGASVVVCGRRSDVVAATVADLQRAGAEVVGLPVDVAKADDVHRLIARAMDRFGRVDVLVNSAGIQRYGTVLETDEATWDEVMAVNLKGMFLASKAAIPEMRRSGGGAIVNVSSVQGLATQKGVAAYSTSKAAINGLTRAMAVDHASDNIRVVAVCPASVRTPMLEASADLFGGEANRETRLAEWGRMHPIGRIGRPEEVAELIAFLAGPRAGFITGGEYTIDGGMMAALGVQLPE